MRMEPDPAPKTVCSILQYQMMDKSKKQVISSVLQYFQNPSELTFVLRHITNFVSHNALPCQHKKKNKLNSDFKDPVRKQ